MADLVKIFTSNWQLISGAWPALLSIITVVGLTVWAFARWSYKERIDTLNTRLQARDDEIKALTAKLAEAQATPKAAQPTDPDQIEQLGRIVGKLHGPEIHRGNGLVLAASLTANGDFNKDRPFMFRDLQLKLFRWDSDTESRIAGEVRKQFAPAVCEILP